MRDRQSNRALNELANKYWHDYENGICPLTQRKLSEGVYEYIATPKPKFLRVTASTR